MDTAVSSAIDKIGSWKDLLIVEGNIRRKGLLTGDAELAIRRRSITLGRSYVAAQLGVDETDLSRAENRILDVVAEYWGIQKRKGKGISRTVEQLKHRGILGAAEFSVCRLKPTAGLQNLVDADRGELSYEQIVIDSSEEFSSRTLWFARRALGMQNDTTSPPAPSDRDVHARTQELLRWLAQRIDPFTGLLTPFANDEAAAAIGMADLSRHGRAYGNLQSRIDYACFKLALPPLGLIAIEPFARAWRAPRESWSFPVAGMQDAARRHPWSNDLLAEVRVVCDSLPGQAWGLWQEAIASGVAVRNWAQALSRGLPKVNLANDDWSEEELSASVAAYFEMLEFEAHSQPYVKTDYYRQLSLRFGRTEKAFEFRMQNISCVLADMDLPWIAGLKPAKNVGTNIRSQLAMIILDFFGRPVETVDATNFLVQCAEDADASGAFDVTSVEDARQRVLSAIVRRIGQPAFRKALLAAYQEKCAITDCDVPHVLEAAHVHPYRGKHTNAVSNGLLLRADIHTLFDLYLIGVDPKTRSVWVSPKLAGTAYAELHGTPLREPAKVDQRASSLALDWHHRQCLL